MRLSSLSALQRHQPLLEPFLKFLSPTTSYSPIRRIQRTRTFSTSPIQHIENRIYSPVRDPANLSTLLALTTSQRIPLLTLWTAAWCPACRTTTGPLLRALIADEKVGEQEGGVGYAEVEIDAPGMGAEAERWFVRGVPTLMAFRIGEAVLEGRRVGGTECGDREVLKGWIEEEARKGAGGERGGGGGWSWGFRGLFGGGGGGGGGEKR